MAHMCTDAFDQRTIISSVAHTKLTYFSSINFDFVRLPHAFSGALEMTSTVNNDDEDDGDGKGVAEGAQKCN